MSTDSKSSIEIPIEVTENEHQHQPITDEPKVKRQNLMMSATSKNSTSCQALHVETNESRQWLKPKGKTEPRVGSSYQVEGL